MGGNQRPKLAQIVSTRQRVTFQRACGRRTGSTPSGHPQIDCRRPETEPCNQPVPSLVTRMHHPVDRFQYTIPELHQPPAPPPPPPPEPEELPVPEGISEEVQAAVDETLGPDATPQQRIEAYEQMQQHRDAFNQDGYRVEFSPTDLQLAAISELTEAGIPTRFDPEVVTAVQDVIKSGTSIINGVRLEAATPEQRLQAYTRVQEHVDARGGIGGAGITADALPARAEELLREQGVPTHASAAAEHVQEALDGFQDMDDMQRLDAMAVAGERLERAIAGLDPNAAAIIIDQALGPIEAHVDQVSAAGSFVDNAWEPTWTSLARVADSIGGTTTGDALINRIADAMITSAGGPGNMDNMVAPLRNQGAGLGLFLHMASNAAASYGEGAANLSMRAVNQALDHYVEHEVQPAIDAYSGHTEELDWLLQNLGPGATPELLEQAVNDYIDANPGWQEQHDALQADLAEQGGNLLQQVDALRQLPAGLEDGFGSDVQERITSLLDDPATGFAIATAASLDPDAISDLDLPAMVSFADGLSLTNRGLGVVKSLATAHVQHNVIGSFADLDPGDAAAVANVRSQIATLREPDVATALGLDPSRLGDLDTAVDELQNILPQNGEVLSEADVQSRLEHLDEELGKLSAFDRSQPLGQVFRGIAVAAGVASVWGSTTGFIDDPSLENGVQLLSGAAGLAVSAGDLAVGLGAIPENSAWGRFSASTTLGKVLGTVGIGLGMVGVVDNLSNGDLTQAGLGALGVGGSALALFGSASWAGPAGVIIGGVAAAASFGVNIYRSIEAQAQLESAGTDFLQSLGYSEEAAQILAGVSGDGNSAMPLLAQYAELKGYDLTDAGDHQAFVDWVNDLDPNVLRALRIDLNAVIDRFDGDPTRLGSDTTEPEIEAGTGPNTGIAGDTHPRQVIYRPETVGEIDAFLRERDGLDGSNALPLNG